MKNLKKLTSLLLALVMVFAMSLSVSAATVTVGKDDNGVLTGHTFKAYQIFAGDYADGKLTNIEWGNGIDKKTFVEKLVALGYTKLVSEGENASTAEDVAKAIAADANEDSIKANKIAQAAYECKKTGIDVNLNAETKLADGYYVIVDETASDGDVAINAALLEIVGDGTVEINVKTDKPSIEKKVKENVKETLGDEKYGEGYNDVADYNIGDAVPFAFYSKAPDMTNYDSYKYTIHDIMSTGLTFNKESVVVTIGSDVLASTEYEIVTEGLTDGCTFEIRIANLKGVAENGDAIRVDFTATLNENAAIGLPGNPNTVRLTYSNNPNDDKSEGRTPDDTVIVFTYELDVTKVDGANTEKKLDTAEFILMNEAKKKAAKVENGKFVGWVDEKEATTLVSDANGNFGVAGLDDGKYYLKETKAPAGYNLLKDPIEVIVKATTNNGQKWTDSDAEKALTNIDVTADSKDGVGDVESGEAKITVANNSGTTLPETGGIGTTMFYVIGAILVVGAAVVMITRKRMSR